MELHSLCNHLLLVILIKLLKVPRYTQTEGDMEKTRFQDIYSSQYLRYFPLNILAMTFCIVSGFLAAKLHCIVMTNKTGRQDVEHPPFQLLLAEIDPLPCKGWTKQDAVFDSFPRSASYISQDCFQHSNRCEAASAGRKVGLLFMCWLGS